MRPILNIVALALWSLCPRPAEAQAAGPKQEAILVDDFESYAPGAAPERWSILHKQDLRPIENGYMRDNERFDVVRDGRGNVLRVFTEGEAVHMAMPNDGDRLSWNLNTHPLLTWRWKATELPTGAREDFERLNDSGAGLYVIFSFGGFLVKRPTAIKYVYSTSLPVGSVIDYGRLQVIVASSAAENETGRWHTVERDVVADYREVFSKDPPEKPLLIRLWGDSDNTGARAEAFFDDIFLRPVGG